jgi:hypothetical protein
MALPENDTPWPPKPMDVAYDAMAGWDAWYSGDTDRLAKRYEQIGGHRSGFVAKGGLVGAAQRFFHGDAQQTATTKLHIPIASDLARTSADLLFAEPPTFQLPDEAKFVEAQERLSLILGDAETASELLEAAEIQAALGGVFMRVIWDPEVFDHVRWTSVHADGAIPEWTYGQMTGVTFWRVLPSNDEKQVWRHLERHAKGVIQHSLYVGTGAKIGLAVPLESHRDTEGLARTVAAAAAGDGISIPLPEGIKTPTAVYIPNVRPNPTWRLSPGLSPLGRSDFDQLEPLFDAADESYSSMVRELRLGKARAFVDQALTDSQGRGRGSTFNSEAEVFVPVEGLGSLKDGAGGIIPYQPELRIRAHREIIEEITATVLRSAGYTASAFGSDTGNNMTATEVDSKQELSARTRTKKIQYWRAALDGLATTTLRLEKAIHGGDFDDSSPVTTKFAQRTELSPLVMAQTIAALNGAGAISYEEKVRRQHPNWSKKQVDDEVALIKAEQAAANAIPDPTVDPDIPPALGR